MAEWLVEFYALENEESPVADWYAAQGSKVQAKLLWTFELLYEIRIRVERNNFRVIYYAYTDRRFILLHGFQKKTQKTPAKELELAQKYMEYFLARDAD